MEVTYMYQRIEDRVEAKMKVRQGKNESEFTEHYPLDTPLREVDALFKKSMEDVLKIKKAADGQ